MATAAAAEADKEKVHNPRIGPRIAVLGLAANELIFAVVGHAGSGTSTVAAALHALLSDAALPGGPYDTSILKARTVIRSWAETSGLPLPDDASATLETVKKYQDLGDQMRQQTTDYSSVAKGLIAAIRATRAEKVKAGDAIDGAVPPDGKRRAYVIDSIRNPAEVELLRHVYQDAFVLVGVVCEETRRLERLTKKYSDAGEKSALAFMKRDEKAGPKYGQRVADAFHLSDFFLDNTVNRILKDGIPNEDWDINEKLNRLIRIVIQHGIVRPETAETAMHHASVAGMRSACLSRQVGAAVTDKYGNVVATGSNEVPRAGGGVYGESYEPGEDHRCAFRPMEAGKHPYCSNNREQSSLVDRLIEAVPELNSVTGLRRLSLKQEITSNGVGDLIEFSRAVHAEMDALLSAGRAGISTIGCRVFVTTFPCHYCARHIVSAGIDEVQFIEPYPKSRAFSLHGDAIALEGKGWVPPSLGGTKSLFHPFVGVAPRLYRKAFLKNRELKNSTGEMDIGESEWGSAHHLRSLSYVDLEAAVLKVS